MPGCARSRSKSCGGHFTEYQTPEGEALRNDERYLRRSVAVRRRRPGATLAQERLTFDTVKLALQLP